MFLDCLESSLWNLDQINFLFNQESRCMGRKARASFSSQQFQDCQPVPFVFVNYFYIELNVYNIFIPGEYAFITPHCLLLYQIFFKFSQLEGEKFYYLRHQFHTQQTAGQVWEILSRYWKQCHPVKRTLEGQRKLQIQTHELFLCGLPGYSNIKPLPYSSLNSAY